MIIKRASETIQNKSPLHIEKILSWIELNCGITRANAKSVMVVLKDTDKITLNEDTGIVYWGKRSQIPQEKKEDTG